LALARGIGSTRAGVVEVTFAEGVILGCYALGKEPPTLPEDVIPLLRQKGKVMA
jgi:hypothetical protein